MMPLIVAWHGVEPQQHKENRVCNRGKKTFFTGGGGGGGDCMVYSRGIRRHNASGSNLGQQSP